jgi:response regulator RpfG family c-di-GMP phosphodiesterase
MNSRPTVVFVDDEPDLLLGLRNRLRGLRRQWDMLFLESGTAAIERLEHGIDVLVTDMRMPGMTGADLLEAVQQRSPGVVRFVLSGYADNALSTRAAVAAHQFFSKPCDTDQLVARVNRLLDQRNGLDGDALSRLGGLRILPLSPRHRLAFEAWYRSPNTDDTTEVATLVQGDPGARLKLLQAANSSFFGTGREVLSVPECARNLGTDVIRGLVHALCDLPEGDAATQEDDVDRLARRSRLRANLAGRLAPPGWADAAATAAALVDVGRLAALGSETPGQDPAGWASYLMTLWGIPIRLVNAVTHHLEPSLDQPLACIVHAARYGVDRCEGPDDPSFRLAKDTLEEAGFLRPLLAALESPDWMSSDEEVLATIGGGS